MKISSLMYIEADQLGLSDNDGSLLGRVYEDHFTFGDGFSLVHKDEIIRKVTGSPDLTFHEYSRISIALRSIPDRVDYIKFH